MKKTDSVVVMTYGACNQPDAGLKSSKNKQIILFAALLLASIWNSLCTQVNKQKDFDIKFIC